MWRSLLLLLIPTGDALGYKPAPPKRHDVNSDNGRFVLDVDPKTKRLTIFAADKRDQPLWSFDNSAWSGHFLSNDGKVVAILHWEFVTVDELVDGVCISFWNEAGKIKEHRFSEVCPHPRRLWFEPGPVGSFWRKWYSNAGPAGDALRVRTTDEFEYTFAMDDGRVMETRRIGLPWWSWWVLLVVGIAGVAALVVYWRSLGRKSAEAAAAPEGHTT